jgi:hypothetical protein
MATKSAESTFVYRNLNSGDALSLAVLNIIQNGIPLTKINLEEAFIIINKNFKYPLKLKVLEAVEDGTIRLIYSPAKTRVPTCLPFFLTKDQSGKIVAFVLVDLYGRLNPDTMVVNIDPKKLYTIMEAALLAITYHQRHREISKRNIIITNGALIYSNMFARVLNKKYALNADKSRLHKVQFLASKFYMLNVLGLEDNDITLNYALKSVPNGNVFQLREVNSAFDDKNYEDLGTFIKGLTDPNLNLGLKDLTVRGYLEAFITMYDGSALFALELFPYFVYTVNSVINGAYLNNQYVLEDIVDKHGAKIYVDLIDFVR